MVMPEQLRLACSLNPKKALVKPCMDAQAEVRPYIPDTSQHLMSNPYLKKGVMEIVTLQCWNPEETNNYGGSFTRPPATQRISETQLTASI